MKNLQPAMSFPDIEQSSSALLALIKDYGQHRSYAHKELIYADGQKPAGFFYIESGLVGLGKLSPNGKQSLLRIYSEQRFFGYRSLLGQDDYYASTMALKPSEIIYFPFLNLNQLLQKVPEAFQFFTIFLASELKEAELRLSRASSMKMKNRVIDSLLYFKNNHDDYDWTYREIGEYSGGETETVIRICNQLVLSGAIKKEQRQLTIIDEDKLLALRDEY